MANFSHQAAQEMIHALLTGSEALMETVTGVFDFVPAKMEYPYITIGNSRAVDESTLGEEIAKLTLTLQVHSRAKGRKEADEVMAAIHAILHDADYAEVVQGYRLISLKYQNSEILLARDGVTYNGRMQFVAYLHAQTT